MKTLLLILALAVTAGTIGCTTVPDGYVRAGDERYYRDHDRWDHDDDDDRWDHDDRWDRDRDDDRWDRDRDDDDRWDRDDDDDRYERVRDQWRRDSYGHSRVNYTYY